MTLVLALVAMAVVGLMGGGTWTLRRRGAGDLSVPAKVPHDVPAEAQDDDVHEHDGQEEHAQRMASSEPAPPWLVEPATVRVLGSAAEQIVALEAAIAHERQLAKAANRRVARYRKELRGLLNQAAEAPIDREVSGTDQQVHPLPVRGNGSKPHGRPKKAAKAAMAKCPLRAAS